jgi:REP element-mobilizing transposase RayT
MSKQHIPLHPDNFYHLFNRAVGNEKLFQTDENYRYFLTRMKQHILPVADLFAYSLLPNHFHLFIRIKPVDNILSFFEKKKRQPFNEKENNLSDFIMKQFSNWLNGYTKAFNKMYNRKGSLFIDYMKRVEAEAESDISSFIFYIHKNAVHHGLKKIIGDWPFDSYRAILSEKPTDLKREEVIEWFGSKQSFIDFHKQPVNLKIKDIDPL